MAKRWYSISVLSNYEKKIAETIRQSVIDSNMEDQIEEVLVPTEEVIEVRRGKKVTTERRFMPGYVLVRMELSDEGYHLITSINRVTGFLGPQGRPMPMRDAEVNQILNRVQEGEEVIEVRRGKKVTTERRFMPGYVLVRMELSDEGYHLITSINRVTGFLGPQGRPMPMRDAEVNQILNRVQEGEEAPRTLIHFEIGEQVKINGGHFEGFDGNVEEVDEENQRLKVTVSIFGRATPVELEFTQVSKQS